MSAAAPDVARRRPGAGVASGGISGVDLAVRLLALPLRLWQTPVGRRLMAAAALTLTLGTAVSALYEHADTAVPASVQGTVAAAMAAPLPRAAVAAKPRAVVQAQAPARAAASAADPAAAAAAWYARAQHVDASRVRALQQRKVSDRQVSVLVMADLGGGRMPTAFVTVRRGAAGWAAG